jgi:hypothetical protein
LVDVGADKRRESPHVRALRQGAEALHVRRPKGIKVGQIVIVDWLDAHTPDNGWDSPKSADLDPSLVRSAGTVVSANAKAIALAGDASPDYNPDDDDSVNRTIVVPWGMVTCVRVVPLPRCEVLK